MAWIKLDDNWMDHPKIIRAGRDARDMWLASITWCAKHLTDGYFPKNLLPQLAVMAGIDVANCQSFANVLLEVCLWDASGDQYIVHDYLDYNPSKEQATATKEARKQAGMAGGKQKASKMASKIVAKACPVPVPLPVPQESDSIKFAIEGERAFPDADAGTWEAPPPPPPAVPEDYDSYTPRQALEVPEIQTFREATGRMPGRPTYGTIIKTIREHSFAADDLKPYWREWNNRGFRPENLAWLLDWAVSGEIPPKNGVVKSNNGPVYQVIN